MYTEGIFEEALSGETHGIVINGEIMNNLRYADDTVIVADNLKDLQYLVNNDFLQTKCSRNKSKQNQNNGNFKKPTTPQ